MATKTIAMGHINNGNDVLLKGVGRMHPFAKSACIVNEVYLVGTDFTSGDDVVLEFKSTTKVFMLATTNNGTVKTYTEAAISAPYVGRKFTFSSVTTDLKVFAITDV